MWTSFSPKRAEFQISSLQAAVARGHETQIGTLHLWYELVKFLNS
jgi:hypothetical protein